MTTTTHVVDNRPSFGSIYRRRGYFFREAAILTISIGVILHIVRVIFGDDIALRYVITPTIDRILLVPMAYAAVTGFAVLRQVQFANTVHRVFFTASVVYLSASVPLHIYASYVVNSTELVTAFPMWFSYLLLIVVYPAFLAMFWRLRYKN
jgi:hypothetical protein